MDQNEPNVWPIVCVTESIQLIKSQYVDHLL